MTKAVRQSIELKKFIATFTFHLKTTYVLLQVHDSEIVVQKDDFKEINFLCVCQNICVVIEHDEHEAYKDNSEQLALLSTQHWKHWCHLVFVVGPTYSSCSRTFVVFLLWNAWSWNQGQLYHIPVIPLHHVFFFEFFSIKSTQVHIWTWTFGSPASPWKQTCWLFFQLLLFAGFSCMLMLMKQNNAVTHFLQPIQHCH